MRTDARLRPPAAAAAAALLLAAWALLPGCGDKIAIPQAEGLFAVNAYYHFESAPGAGARQLCVANGKVFVTADDGSLTRRFQDFGEDGRVDGLADPTALTRSEDGAVIFVWEAGAGRLSAWAASDLSPLGAAELPEVGSVTHLGAATAGLTGTVDTLTYVYLADADSVVVHRYAWTAAGEALPAGLLCTDAGGSARAVKSPAGMAVDLEGRLLICDADTARNWVTRFDPTPAADEPLGLGTVVVFAEDGCFPPATAAYTLGDAPQCGETDWTGGPSDAQGEFHAPRAVAVDGSGRAFVADTGNARFQVFHAAGDYDLEYATDAFTAAPVSIAVVDKFVNESKINFGAYVFVAAGDGGGLHSFISSEEYARINTGQPPPPQ